jgi:hypothetical protein
MALAQRRRPVVALLLKDLSDASVRAADAFFAAVAVQLKERRRTS